MSVFPARAGMIPLGAGCGSRIRCIPRESGDDPYGKGIRTWLYMYSPRERG